MRLVVVVLKGISVILTMCFRTCSIFAGHGLFYVARHCICGVNQQAVGKSGINAKSSFLGMNTGFEEFVESMRKDFGRKTYGNPSAPGQVRGT